MRVELQFVGGPFDGRRVLVRKGFSIVFGRTEMAEYRIPHDAQMSGRHMRIEHQGNICSVNDLKSSNGTDAAGSRCMDAGFVAQEARNRRAKERKINRKFTIDTYRQQNSAY